jgi:lysine 6-dehydrogenase
VSRWRRIAGSRQAWRRSWVLVRRLGGRADALRLYVGGLPEQPTPSFHYQLVFSVEGLINEYVEPVRILRKGKLTTIDPLTEPEDFHIAGFSPLVAFHTSGGTAGHI